MTSTVDDEPSPPEEQPNKQVDQHQGHHEVNQDTGPAQPTQTSPVLGEDHDHDACTYYHGVVQHLETYREEPPALPRYPHGSPGRDDSEEQEAQPPAHTQGDRKPQGGQVATVHVQDVEDQGERTSKNSGQTEPNSTFKVFRVHCTPPQC